MTNTQNIDRLSIDEGHYVVLDFETVTPKGRPPEPIEIAAMRINPGRQVDAQFKFNRLIQPPNGAPITPFDTVQTGIRWDDVRAMPMAQAVLTEFDERLEGTQYVLVAQNARYEAAIIQRFSSECPRASKMPFVDTVALAKHLLPGPGNYKLDTLANHFSIPVPAQRHRALPDVQLTVQVFLQLLQVGLSTKKIKLIGDLRRVGGIKRDSGEKSDQISLFLE
jgi:DNA polymerase-3 subunit epsilon